MTHIEVNRLVSGNKYKIIYKDHDSFERIVIGIVMSFNTSASVVVLTDEDKLYIFPHSSIRWMYPIRSDVKSNLQDELKRIDEFFENLSMEEFERIAIECGMGKTKKDRRD